MCYDRGTLQAYLDKQLDIHESWEVERHVADCECCKALLGELKRNQDFAGRTLGAYRRETAALPFNSDRAWSLFNQRVQQPEASSRHGGILQMLMQSKHRKPLVAVATALLVVGLLSYAPARSIAASFLTIFRAEKIQIVAINPDDLRKFEKVLKDAGVADVKDFGKIEVTGKRASTTVTATEAASQAGFSTKLPKSLGPKLDMTEVKLQTNSTISITPDVDKVNNLLKSLGANQMLPANLSGKTFIVKMPAVVSANYAGEPGKVDLIQAPSPEMIAPEGVDVEAIRKAMLGIPSLPEQMRQQLSIKEWQRTVLVPSSGGRTQEVSVNGVTGIFITQSETAATKPMSALVWQQNGVWYSLTGEISLQQAQAMAGMLK